MFKNCDLRCKITFDAFHVWPFICIKHCPCITMSPLSHSVIRNITLLLPLRLLRLLLLCYYAFYSTFTFIYSDRLFTVVNTKTSLLAQKTIVISTSNVKTLVISDINICIDINKSDTETFRMSSFDLI
jgi:hypothetical protein